MTPPDKPPAIDRGPTRTSLPYSCQEIDPADIDAVIEVLRSDWLTTGPKVEAFERAFAAKVGAAEAVAVANGTAALHAAMFALGIGPGDEVIVPAMTFAATANCVVYLGGKPVFADVEPDTLLLDPAKAEAKVTPRTRAIVAVDYAGQPCNYDALSQIAKKHDLALVADACHALGGSYKGRSVGTLAKLNTFSFHPVKPITSAEGGMITTEDGTLARAMRKFRNHGITTDHRQREQQGSWFYEMEALGYNYRLSDLHCALGQSQLDRLAGWVQRRQALARRYDVALAEVSGVEPLVRRPDVEHAYHLYVVRLATGKSQPRRQKVFTAMRQAGFGVNVLYIPVHLHPFYRQHLGTRPGLCPTAEAAYEQILSLPLFPAMSDTDVDRVVEAIANAVASGGKLNSLHR